jgi:phage major head subunit gpT-like protein
MGQVVPSDLAKNLLPGLRTEFMQQYKDVSRPFERVSTLVPSTHLSEDYTWLGQTPAMREFGAERIPKGLSEFTYTIRNKKWESSIRVDNDALRFEQYGQIKARVNQLARAIPRHKNKLVWELLSAGFTTTGYDGQFFFDTDHSEGNSGIQSNKLTVALTAANFATARARIRGFKDDQGELLGIGYDGLLLVVPPGLEAAALAILNAELVSDGTTTINNIWKGSADLLVSPFLTDADDWFLIDTTQFLKPVILQQVGNDQNFGLVNTEGGDDEFMRDHVNYGVGPVHYNVGYGDWRVAVGSSV